ncbi:MAG TPA: hypothetical protein VGG27_10880 [Magnetospirillaceae bacterium]|jgi:hypothetical protein
MGPKDIGVIAGVIVTLLLGAWNLLYSIRTNRRAAFINTVTSERVKWIGKLRENLSKFVGLTHQWLSVHGSDRDKAEELVGQLNVLRYEIKLQLNPTSSLDRAIIELVNEIPDVVTRPDRTIAHASMDKLIEYSQVLLKTEWEKVKQESQRGALSDVGSPYLSRSKRYVVAIGCLIFAFLLAINYLRWDSFDSDRAKAGRLVVPLHLDQRVEPCPTSMTASEKFLRCDSDGMYRSTQWSGIWVRDEHSVPTGLYVGILIPLLLLVVAILLFLGNTAGVSQPDWLRKVLATNSAESDPEDINAKKE